MADIREALERALARTERLASDARGPMALDLKFIAEDIRAALADDGWRDMESAPKDGEMVLLATPQNKCFPGPVCGLWHDGDWHFVEDAEDMTNGGNSWVEGYGPTHWRPLPQPPEESA